MRALMFSLAFVCMPTLAVAAAPGQNDTGVTQCANGSIDGWAACSISNTGDAAPAPRQDARFGRDAAATVGLLTKTGGGAVGFDFTPLDSSGTVITITDGVPASTPSCVHDNVTDLTWEVPATATAYTLAAANTYVTTTNTNHLCGTQASWRLPTLQELISIAHYGSIASPFIDTNYFPNTASDFYWSSSPTFVSSGFVLSESVTFLNGSVTYKFNDSASLYLRLVRTGP
jgi:hypothetical protein